MTRLESYLEKNCVAVDTAHTTNSKYYRIGAAIVRYSDHFSDDYPKFDIQIIRPTGSFSCLYMFGVSGNSKLSLMNAKQIIAYLPYVSMTAELLGRKILRNCKKFEPDTLIESKLEKNGQFASIVYRMRSPFRESEINYLPTMMGMEFGAGAGINDAFKKFLRKTPLQYQEMLNIFKIVIIDNEETATNSNLTEALEKVKSLMVKK